jgi:hypothetical protein
VPSAAVYPAVLAEALREPQFTEAQREGVEKLLYHMIFEQLVPFNRDTLSVTPQAADALVNHGAFKGLWQEPKEEKSAPPAYIPPAVPLELPAFAEIAAG